MDLHGDGLVAGFRHFGAVLLDDVVVGARPALFHQVGVGGLFHDLLRRADGRLGWRRRRRRYDALLGLPRRRGGYVSGGGRQSRHRRRRGDHSGLVQALDVLLFLNRPHAAKDVGEHVAQRKTASAESQHPLRVRLPRPRLAASAALRPQPGQLGVVDRETLLGLLNRAVRVAAPHLADGDHLLALAIDKLADPGKQARPAHQRNAGVTKDRHPVVHDHQRGHRLHRRHAQLHAAHDDHAHGLGAFERIGRHARPVDGVSEPIGLGQIARHQSGDASAGNHWRLGHASRLCGGRQGCDIALRHQTLLSSTASTPGQGTPALIRRVPMVRTTSTISACSGSAFRMASRAARRSVTR